MGSQQSAPPLKGTGFEPRELERPTALAKFAPSDSPYKGAVECNRERIAAAKIVDREAALDPEHVHCRRCKAETVQIPVFWYTARVQYQPPLVTIFGHAIGGLEAPVYVLWCTRHRGEPPARYPAPTPAGNGKR